MQKTHRLIIDQFAEVRYMLGTWADDIFYDFGTVVPTAGSIYIIGRQQFMDHCQKILDMSEDKDYVIVFNNSAEGSWTIASQLLQFKIDQLVLDGKILIISGAEISPNHVCLTHEHLLTKIMDFTETLDAQAHTDSIFQKKSKPFQFLFLNGRARPHRKYLYERLRRLGLLDRALYTMLQNTPCVARRFTFRENGIDIMATPTALQRLPDRYEIPRYRDPVFGPIVPGRTFIKTDLFRKEWGEIYLYHEPYVDTYFSLVTETVCAESDISFRTEKIAKPLAMGHPFVIAANRGYYRDLRNLGFQTFDHLIDETFDLIDDAQDRMDRLIQIVQDLCNQDLGSFLSACEQNCKYNQQHLAEFTREHRQQFPIRFFQFIQDHARS